MSLLNNATQMQVLTSVGDISICIAAPSFFVSMVAISNNIPSWASSRRRLFSSALAEYDPGVKKLKYR